MCTSAQGLKPELDVTDRLERSNTSQGLVGYCPSHRKAIVETVSRPDLQIDLANVLIGRTESASASGLPANELETLFLPGGSDNPTLAQLCWKRA